ncbi:MAG: glycosyl hydrolase-related protein [Ruminococcus sp.]|nr:glycosyl hydrolase-related protein [Ruminococcus sp.]MDY3895214.1 glycoside hydrolase family 38 C-terminal domain-containing protein [Candidatus Fimenecus sp.]
MSKKKKIYTVATAHLDTVWSWDFETTISKYIYNTLVDNFKLFEKYPTYTFSFEGSYRYELMEEYYPELFERAKQYIKDGRWNVCGSSFENGDVNIPSPEALFRNILIGNSYFDEKFGKRSTDIFLPDCFGFGWALPSIASHAHLTGFTTQKLAWGSAYGIPFDIGRWRGVDGKEIYACLNPHDYYFTLKKLRDWDFVQKKLKENEKYGLDMTYIFHGIGDRGGAPKEESVKFVEEEIKKNGTSDIEVIAASADEIYRDIERDFTAEQKEKLPVWNNELVMKDHAVGGYTSRAVGKRWNRRCQELADSAERIGVISDYLGLLPYNRQALGKAWKRVIAHQFHDDIPGTSCQRVYRRSWNDYAVSMNQFANELEAAASSLSSVMKTDFCKGTPVMVYNPIEADRYETVTVRLKGSDYDNIRVFDDGGAEVKSQIINRKNDCTEVVFTAEVKSLGARIYDVRESNSGCRLKGEISVHSGKVLENQKYIVTLNENGDIGSIIDKEQNNSEILKEPVSLGLFKYKGSRVWPAWEMNYEENKREADRIPAAVKIQVVENGAARVMLKVTQRDKNSTFVNTIALSDRGDTVEVRSEIEWQSLCTMAKQKFSFNCENETATFDLGLGAVKRGNMSEKLYEVPAQNWADITDRSGKSGVSVISECKYGWDKFNNNTLRLTVLHTPKYNYRIDSMQSMMDLGLNRYSYAIFSHKGAVGEKTQLAARRFITPMSTYICSKHDGKLGTQYSFGTVSTNDVIIRAIKAAEKGDEIIVRLNEGICRNAEDFELYLGNGIESAREVYASEEYKGEAQVKDGKLVTSFNPYEIKSFALKLKKAASTFAETAEPVKLPLDKNIITRQGANGDFEFTVPYEIAPETVFANGYEFPVVKDSDNALTADGQNIAINKNAHKIAFLCASLTKDKTADFLVDGNKVKVKVYSCFERFAAWDLYDFGETAYMKDGKIAYEATHAHANRKDVPAKSMYFYIAELDVSGANSVTLPTDNDIVILSACTLNYGGAVSAFPVYDEVPDNRSFTFSLDFKEKVNYLLNKCVWNFTDKGEFIKANNRGREK